MIYEPYAPFVAKNHTRFTGSTSRTWVTPSGQVNSSRSFASPGITFETEFVKYQSW